MVINQMNNILSTFFIFYIWFLILLVLEIHYSKGFNQKGLWKLDRRYVNKGLVIAKSKQYSVEGTNAVEQCIQRNRKKRKQRSNISNNINSKRGIESMYKIFIIDLIFLKSYMQI